MLTKKWLTIGFLAVLCLAFVLPTASQAAVKYWEPADGIGNWNYGPYWDPAGVPIAGDTVRIEAGGSGWTLYCYYVNGTNPLLNSIYIGNLDAGTAEARMVQGQDALHTGYEYVGYRGAGKHFQSGGSVTVDNALYLGRLSGSYGYYALSGGTLSAAYSHVGYGGEGEFVQTGGTFTCTQMSIADANYGGPYGAGSYAMQNGTLNAGLIYLGGKEEGTFTQSGGTVNALSSGITLGLDQLGGGHYSLTSGDLNTYRTRLSWAGSTFNQSGGTHDITDNLEVGYGSSVLDEALYTLSGTGALTVGDDLYLGQSGHTAPGRYRQTGGTAVVTDMLILAEPTGTLQLLGGTFTCDEVSNDGHYHQSGGTLTTGAWTNTYDFQQTGGILNASLYTNNALEDMVIDNAADCRIDSLAGNTGRVWLKSCYLRGSQAGGGVYNRCAFTNAAAFQMDGGEFLGDLINNGTFTYNGGTFNQSTFTNYGGYGSVNLNAWFACRRIVNHGSLTVVWDRRVYADGVGYANAVENNGSLTLYPRSELNLYNFSTKLVNNGQMYAGGAVPEEAYVLGTLENHGYLLPCAGGADPGHLYVNGNFIALPGAALRIRIRGTAFDDYDHMYVQFNANLGGELDVRLTEGFVPSVGNSFTGVGYSSHSGAFNPVYLPALPAGLEWALTYGATGVVLTVVEEPSIYYGDMNCDNVVDMDDVPLFVEALVDPADFGGCDIERADTNEDTLINGADTQGFVTLLLGD